MSLLELEGIGRRFGYRRVLEGVDLKVAAGDLVCLLGPNGAGKSTLLRTISARTAPDAGRLLHEGRPVLTQEDRRRLLAITAELSHQTGLLLDQTAPENLRFFLSLSRKPEGDREQRIAAALTRVGLAHRALDPVRQFSRGMRQRLALARVFLARPRIVLLDEPFTGLDARGQELLVEWIAEERSRGTAFLAAIHSEEHLEAKATRFVYLKEGRVVADIERARYGPAARSEVRRLLYGA